MSFLWVLASVCLFSLGSSSEVEPTEQCSDKYPHSATVLLQVNAQKSRPDVNKDVALQMKEEHTTTMDQKKIDAILAKSQSVHWVFVTDCSAYQFNQGNMLLASAHSVKQPGNFSWVVYGCQRDEQKKALLQLVHPGAQVWHTPTIKNIHPDTGKVYKDFQASNRPASIYAWWKATQPKEDAISIIDPDMFFMRPVSLVDVAQSGSSSKQGPWETDAAKPKQGTGAMYGIGCILLNHDFTDEMLQKICKGDDATQKCRDVKARGDEQCRQSYSSGPPWILHRSDAEDVLGSWMPTAIRTHENWPVLLAEQGSYGIAQTIFDVKNKLDVFWFLSNTNAGEQPWKAVEDAEWDPCHARSAPPSDLAIPPLWHSCSAFTIKSIPGFTLHKDHIHKDLMDCRSPLLRYPPQDALKEFKNNSLQGVSQTNAIAEAKLSQEKQEEFRGTWAVCAYTNLVNTYATQWKQKFCKETAPNLEASFAYPDHAQGFLNEDSWVNRVFRKGGWTDVDYTTGAGSSQ